MAQRRTVMKAFGKYLDYARWLAAIKTGTEAVPEGYSISGMAQGVKQLETHYLKLLREHVHDGGEDEDDG